VARKPIETIGFCTILVVCACYFLWQTIKHDSLFAGSHGAGFPAYAVNYVRTDNSKFNIASHSAPMSAMQGVDIFAVALHGNHMQPQASSSSRRQKSAFRKAMAEVEAIFGQIQTEQFSGHAFSDVCAKAEGDGCLALGPSSAGRASEGDYEFLRGSLESPGTVL
ncbi:hypothetical protein LPJ71_010830, partial [Coemansia sp. S17]